AADTTRRPGGDDQPDGDQQTADKYPRMCADVDGQSNRETKKRQEHLHTEPDAFIAFVRQGFDSSKTAFVIPADQKIAGEPETDCQQHRVESEKPAGNRKGLDHEGQSHWDDSEALTVRVIRSEFVNIVEGDFFFSHRSPATD